MIVDRTYHFAAAILAFIIWRADLLFVLVLAAMVLFYLLLPVALGLLIWQSVVHVAGPKRRRALARLRWSLSRSMGWLRRRQQRNATRTAMRVYGIEPEAPLPGQSDQLAELMRDAFALDRAVPAILQRPLTAGSLGAAIADAYGLSDVAQTVLIDALARVEPADRTGGPTAQLRATFRRILAPLVGSARQRERIARV